MRMLDLFAYTYATRCHALRPPIRPKGGPMGGSECAGGTDGGPAGSKRRCGRQGRREQGRRECGGRGTGLMASAIRQRSLRRGGTLAGEASGGGWREWCGCSGNALRWLP